MEEAEVRSTALCKVKLTGVIRKWGSPDYPRLFGPDKAICPILDWGFKSSTPATQQCRFRLTARREPRYRNRANADCAYATCPSPVRRRFLGGLLDRWATSPQDVMPLTKYCCKPGRMRRRTSLRGQRGCPVTVGHKVLRSPSGVPGVHNPGIDDQEPPR